MKRKLLFTSIIVALIGLPQVRGQSIWPSTLNATGGSATLGGRTYEWSIGEMTLVSTAATSSIVVTQGLLQPEHGVTAVEDRNILKFLTVFPNPANNTINYTFNSPQKAVIGLRLMDMSGKVIQEKSNDVKTGMNTGQLDISSLAAATYLLQVDLTSDETLIETTAYKIQKLQ